MSTEPHTLHKALSTIEYPISKDRLLNHVEAHHVHEEVVRSLRAMPAAQYTNAGQVIRAIPSGQGSDGDG